MRLARTEEPGHPHTHHVARGPATTQRFAHLRERVEHAAQLVLDLVSDDVFAYLAGEGRSIEHLDDAFDFDADVALDGFPNGGHMQLSTLQRAVNLTAR